MARLATKRRSIRTAPGHTVLELTFVRINVTSRAALIQEMKREHLIRWAARAEFVAFIARHRRVRAGQRESRLAMIGDRKCRTVKVLHGVAALAPVLIRCSLKLPFVDIFVTVQAGRKFHFVNRILTGGNVAFRAIHCGMLAG